MPAGGDDARVSPSPGRPARAPSRWRRDPMTVEQFTIWKNGPETDPGPIHARSLGLGAVPVWFVAWPELEAAIADGGLASASPRSTRPSAGRSACPGAWIDPFLTPSTPDCGALNATLGSASKLGRPARIPAELYVRIENYGWLLAAWSQVRSAPPNVRPGTRSESRLQAPPGAREENRAVQRGCSITSPWRGVTYA